MKTAEKTANTNIMIIKPYSKKELRELYGVGKGTLRLWLKDDDDYLGKNTKLFDVAKVEFIFKKYGYPKNIIQ